ncbi:MAG: PIN domain-containing protein [Planctomycetota bacterium]
MLIDTSVLIEAEKSTSELAAVLPVDGPVCISAIGLAELLVGSYAGADEDARRRRREFHDVIRRRLRIIDFGAEEADRYARIVGGLHMTRSERLDFMIASTALVHDLTLVTRDKKSSRRVADLKLRVI